MVLGASLKVSLERSPYKARLISRIETTPSYGVEEGVLLKPKIIAL